MVANGWRSVANTASGPNINDAYGIRELAAYDPIIPKAVFPTG